MRLTTCFLFCSLLFAGTAAANSSVSLDGDWHFVADPGGSLRVQDLASARYILPTRVPSSWQAQFADLRDYAGVAWYWRDITVETPPADQVMLLRFGAVDYKADVFVNAQSAGSHEGGYLPFEIDATSLLHAGKNQIAVRVTDPGAKPHDVIEGIDYAEIPHGKQSWYVQTSGLWQSATLEYRPRLRLGNVHIAAGADGSFAIAAPVVGGNLASGARITATILDANSKTLWTNSQNASGENTGAKFNGQIRDPLLWSPSSPNLYTLHVSLSSGDDYQARFGFRTFTTHDGKFYLNGNPVYLRGALDQDFYPDTIYTTPSHDYVLDEMHKAKSIGLNLLRCHIKVPDPRYLDAADETGMLIWYEIPNWDKLTADSKRRAMETLHGMVERDANHPCIIAVSILNESWGADLKDVTQRAWLKSTYEQAKTFVPWLVVDNSPCCDNFHMETDIADFHQYSAVPDHASNFDRFIDDQAQRPGWLFSPYGDASRKGNEPLMLSEFGVWGLPQVPQEKPWWFNRGSNEIDVTKPEGIEQRFAEYQYSSLFPDLKSLSEAAQWHEFRALRYEIGALRAHPEFQGYVITEFTDINWEANGLLDMERHPKAFGEALSQLQQDDLLVLRGDKRNYKAGETAQASVYVSHYGPGDWANARVDWRVEGTTLAGTIPITTVPSASAVKTGDIHFPVPSGTTPAKRVLSASLVVSGKPVSTNSLDYFFYPNKQLDLPTSVAFYDPPPNRLRRLINDMHDRNYLPPSGSEAFPVLITSTLDDSVKNKLRDGARVILIATDAMKLAPGIEIIARAGTILNGDWIANLMWIRKDQPPFTGIGFDTLGGFETQAVNPAAVIRGIPPRNFHDVLAGMFFGWIHDNVGVLVQAKAGKGKLLICTFSLGTTYNSDPYATHLLDALVSYATSDFSPQFELPL